MFSPLVSSRLSGFLSPPLKHASRRIGYANLPLGVNACVLMVLCDGSTTTVTGMKRLLKINE